jgi:hypothetical protein
MPRVSKGTVTIRKALFLTLVGACSALLDLYSASAFEPGQSPQTKAGTALGLSAAPLPSGLYMIESAFYYGFQVVGPGTAGASGTRGFAPEGAVDFLWVPGWNFLGAKYSALVALPIDAVSITKAPSVGFEGVYFVGSHNAFIQPVRLQWDLGNGFFVQAGSGIYVPSGTIKGQLGENNSGADYFTVQPHLVFSYVKGGWNLTSYLYYEHNTTNKRSGYTSGDIIHVDLTATKRFDKWTVGPVAYYVSEVTSDRPGARLDQALTTAIPVPGGFHGFNAGKFEGLAVGGLIGYDFEAAALSIIATNEFFARASPGYSGTPYIQEVPFGNGVTPRGWTISGRLTHRIWAPPATLPRDTPSMRK